MDLDDDTPAFAKSLGAMYGSSPESSADEEDEENIITTKNTALVEDSSKHEIRKTVEASEGASNEVTEGVDTTITETKITGDAHQEETQEAEVLTHEKALEESISTSDDDHHPQMEIIEKTSIADTKEAEESVTFSSTENKLQVTPETSDNILTSESVEVFPENLDPQIESTNTDEMLPQEESNFNSCDPLTSDDNQTANQPETNDQNVLKPATESMNHFDETRSEDIRVPPFNQSAQHHDHELHEDDKVFGVESNVASQSPCFEDENSKSEQGESNVQSSHEVDCAAPPSDLADSDDHKPSNQTESDSKSYQVDNDVCNPPIQAAHEYKEPPIVSNDESMNDDNYEFHSSLSKQQCEDISSAAHEGELETAKSASEDTSSAAHEGELGAVKSASEDISSAAQEGELETVKSASEDISSATHEGVLETVKSPSEDISSATHEGGMEAVKSASEDISSAAREGELETVKSASPRMESTDESASPSSPKMQDEEPEQFTQSDEISSQSLDLESAAATCLKELTETITSEDVPQTIPKPESENVSILPSQPSPEPSTDSENAFSQIQTEGECFRDSDSASGLEKNLVVINAEDSRSFAANEEEDDSQHLLISKEITADEKGRPSSESRKSSSGKSSAESLGGRRLRQIRHPSAKAAEAAADAAFVAAVTPTRKNLKEAKIACAIANVSDSADMNLLTKKSTGQTPASRSKKIRSSSVEPTLFAPADSSGVYVDETSSSEKSVTAEGVTNDDRNFSKVGNISEESSDVSDESVDFAQSKMPTVGEPGKLMGIKLKISKESVQILDPSLKKLEVQIPSEMAEVTSATPSPGGSKKSRKSKDEALPSSSLSPITLKIAKSKEGLEVIPGDADAAISDSETAKVEKITLKLSKDDSASIVKQSTSWEESAESKSEKSSLKASKDEVKLEDSEETKLEKITLKLSKDDGACIIKKKDSDVSSSAESEGGKLERITLKLSPDNNVSIKRGKESCSVENNSNLSELGKVEKITLKVSKNDNVCIIKPSSPVPPMSSVEKLTLKVSKDGTAAVSGKSRDDSPSSREPDCSKLEKITLKLSKDEGVSIVKPSSPTPERINKKMPKDEPLSPLSPLTILRSEESEPQKERITLKLSKAGGHPSPVGTLEERTSWSIKSMETDTTAQTAECVTPKSKPKRILNEALETVPTKKVKLSEIERSSDSDDITIIENIPHSEKEESYSDETPVESDLNASSKRVADNFEPGDSKKIKIHESQTSQPLNVWPSAGKAVEVVDIDSEDSKSVPPTVTQTSFDDQKMSIIDLEDEIPSSVVVKRKPRGRPRKVVLTPGAIPPGTIACSPDTSVTRKTIPKSKKERALLEPPESDRPKRSCKGREKPPPKPPKPVKPRGRNAVAAKQGASEDSPAPNTITVEAPQLFEEETRMSADCGSRSQTPAPAAPSMPVNGLQMTPKVMIPRLSTSSLSMHSTPSATPAQSPGPPPLNEESQSSLSMVSSTTNNESTPNKGNRKGRMEINVDPDAKVEYTVDMIAEYVWPVGDARGGETYMIQEQISEYLKVKSFKRKYPTMVRRTVDHDERQYLLERKLVSESLCDMGLTAVPSHEVLDVMCTDFPEKYEEYRRYTREKAARELSNKQKALAVGSFSGKEDPKSKAMRNMATFNSVLNRSRRDHRRCCFDLQTFSVHYPEDRRRRMTAPNVPRVGPYPLALVPGQFTDYYKEYTATELRYFPLNTVLYGPLLPHETMKVHTSGGSDGSQTDTSDSSSSDGTSSESASSGSDSDTDSGSSSESEDESSNHTGAGPAECQDSETDHPDAICRICNGDRHKNKAGRAEPLVHCANCAKSGHPSCLDLTVDMVPHIKKYAWQCTDCKLCAQCNDTADEDKMLFCDMCDRGYHIYCVGLRKVPDGRWHCRECAMCASCGARNPGGTEEQQAAISQAAQDTPSKVEIPQWQHEFKKGDKGTRIYVRTLCVPCSKLWRKGRYCRLCWKCYGNQPEEEGLINCSVCDRWMHADCCRKAGRVIDMDKLGSFLCELCQQKGVRIPGTKSPSKLYRP